MCVGLKIFFSNLGLGKLRILEDRWAFDKVPSMSGESFFPNG
jgi:hypothetical protein